MIRSSWARRAIPLGIPICRMRRGRAKTLSVQMIASRYTSLATWGGVETAAAPGRLPETMTRCFTRSGCRSANWTAEVAPDEMAITSEPDDPDLVEQNREGVGLVRRTGAVGAWSSRGNRSARGPPLDGPGGSGRVRTPAPHHNRRRSHGSTAVVHRRRARRIRPHQTWSRERSAQELPVVHMRRQDRLGSAGPGGSRRKQLHLPVPAGASASSCAAPIVDRNQCPASRYLDSRLSDHVFRLERPTTFIACG